MSSTLKLTDLTPAERLELLKMARARDLERKKPELPPIEPAARDGRLPLSFAQQRLWFLEQLGELGSTYHIPKRLRLRGELDRAALSRALDGVVARHEALRTTFTETGGVPEQRIAPPDVGFLLVDHDLEGRPDAHAELERLMVEEVREPFDLERGPLVRGRLIRLAADDHVLLITMHHIVGDGWSSGVLFKELSALYAGYREGREVELPVLPVQYADYAVWQRRWVEGEVLQQQADYWTRTLAGAPELFEVATDRPRPAEQDHAGAQLRLELDETLTAGLRALSRRHGTTLFMTLLAGWAVVLGRLSGQDDVVIGTPTAGRGRREIEGLIGFFVNTLALRMDLSGSPTVAELLGRVRERTAEAQRNQDIPFEQVVERVDPVRSLAHNPLFQVLFVWQGAAGGEGLSLPGLAVDGVEEGPLATTAKFDLALALWEGDRIAGSVTYATSLFERATVERYVGYLRRVLEEMVADDGQRVERLALMPAGERRRVVEEWNRTEADYPGESCIHELIEAQVERTPEATAVIFEGEHVTYAELNRRSNRLAHHLRGLGVGPDARVALCVDRSVEMVVGLLAVLKAGGAYVPLDPGLPAERLAYMLADSAPAAVLVQTELRDRVAGAGVPVLELDAATPAWSSESEANLERGVLTSAHLAYVIYTSGSTGRPKGVMNTHRSVAGLLAASQEMWKLGAGDVVLQNIPYSFDVSVRELFWPLAAGGRVVLPRPGGHRDIAYVIETIARERITTASVAASTLPVFLGHPEVAACADLARVLSGGDALTPALVERFYARLPNATLYHMYGPTETTVAVTGGPSRPGEPNGRVSMGRPVANTRAYVLDERGEPVPVGVAGELCIGGAQVARGYLGAPEQTAERFVADPFGGEPGGRLYRTGDLVRWLAAGTLEFLGRTDQQVKVRGYRIEPGEIEARLVEHAGVRDAAVVAREDTGEKRLVAYVVGDEQATADVLRAHLGATLPEHMVPAAFVRMDRLPLLHNGKLDRNALPAPEGDAFAVREYEAPVDETEAALAGIWAEVLHVERVGRHDNFFELGGHSLLAVQVISRVRQALAVEVALGSLFTRPVLAEFARGLETAARAELPPVVPVPREGRIPLSFAQQRLWFLEQLGGLGSAYHMRTGRRLRGELDRAALGRALDGLVARHEALRTVFAQVNGAPEQRIAPPDAGFHLAEHDLAGRADAHAQLGRLLAAEAETPFDLERGPLIRGLLVRLAEDDHVLVLTMHHIVTDGWSMGVLTRELAALYAAHHQGRDAGLPALPVQYADYAVWQRRWVEGDVLRQQAEYWTETLAGAPELLALPADHPRPALLDPAGARLEVVLDEALTARLKALSRRHGATLFMTLLAGWAAVLARLSGQDDVVVGTPAAGRGRREIEGLIGFFLNTLALRVDLSGSPTVAELLGRVKQRTLAAQAHQDIPFEQVVELADPARSLSRTPLFQVLFTWQNTPPGEALSLPGLEVGPVGAAAQAVDAKYDLSLTLREAGDRIVGGVTYATALFERDTVERYAGYLRRMLEEMAADDGARVDAVALMAPDERAMVVEEWNRTEVPYPAGLCIHELFEEQVARTPDAVAVVFAGGQLTYAELDRRANQLAHHLRRLGVGPEDRVSLCMERAPELMAAFFGVLKAGAAYVPLDPAHPAERLGYMLRDSGARLLLTQSWLRGRLPDDRPETLWVDLMAAALAAEPDGRPESGVRPDNLAYVYYTSGSTGRPKGVAMHHYGPANYFDWGRGAYRAAEGRGAPVFSSMAVDLTLANFIPLFAGERVELLPEGPGVEALADTLRREPGFAMIKITPTHLALLNQALSPRDAARAAGTLVIGADNLLAEPTLFWRDHAPGVRLLNEYGPTETVVGCSLYEIPPDARREGRVSIGRPIHNITMYVLDARLQPVPPGVRGELFIGGVGVARGYLGRPALTAEKFVPDPFAAAAGARLYRTGDRARFLADGNIEFLGRMDFQVKIRGYRIETGEIEARLTEHPGVREAVVLAREDTPGDTRLVAYVVGDDTAAADVLQAYLGETLPAYMVPAAYVRLERLPLAANGKLDRKALPAPEGDAYARRGYEAPAGEVEETLAAIWSEVLGVERVGRWDNFFELGGHSLLVVQAVARMRGRGLHAEVRALFTAPTLAALAAEVGGESAEVEVPANRIPAGCVRVTPEMLPLVSLDQAEIDRIVAAVPGGAANVQDVYPLAPLQEGILFHHLMATEGDPYLLAFLHGFDSRDALESYLGALQAVIDRHDVLRTAVMWEGLREPVQVVWRRAPLRVEEVALDPAGGEAEEQLHARFDPRHHRIDVREAPLMRAQVAHDAARGRWVLLLLRHHLASDHTATDVLNGEIQAHLQGRAGQLPAPLPFRNYVAQVRLGVSQDEHRQFFTALLGDVSEPTAPFGLLDVRGDGSGIEEARLRVDERLDARLRERARALGVGAATLCHVAWAQVLARVSGRSDVVFGTVLFGRMQGGEGTDRVMGPFINTLPIRIRVSGEGVEASVRETHALLAKLLRHEHASLALAQRCSAVEASAPLFTTLLNYRHGGKKKGTDAPAAALSADAGTRKRYTQERSNYPLTMTVDDLGEAMRLTAKVKAQVEAARVCALMHTALEGLVEALETAPWRALGSIDVLPAEERSRVVDEWNRTEADFPQDLCVHELFESRVEHAPDATALVFRGESLTYAELNARANRLAHHLRSLGVGPDVRVGICAERSLEMVVGLLGVLKAGGAYVPLDPGYPPERLRYMVENSAPVVVLTQAELRDRVDGLGAATIALDADAGSWSDRPATNPARGALLPDHLTHVIYTSGSTGRPKGVMMEHRGGVNRFVWMQRLHRLGVDDDGAMLQNSSFSFDASVWELLWPLSSGARVVLSPPQAHQDLDGLVATIRREGVRAAFFVPSMLQLLLENGGVEGSGLRRVMCGGEALPPALARRLEEVLPGVVLFNMFGPSEASQAVMGQVRVREGDTTVPLGRPNPNTRVYILDASGAPVPAGVVGELYIGGVQMARGYLGRPELTAERFLPDPFGREPGGRLYQTGDLGRWREDGRIEYLGRIDFQVKVRGFRIELGEIEARLREHPGVREAVVVAREDTPGDKRLAAYWVGEGVDPETLRAQLGRTLPAYMVPSAYVRMDEFPLSPNGKLDRAALPAPEGAAHAARGYEAPVGETEQALAEIWAEVLGLERVGRRDNFFELGGHSLLAVQVISRMRQVLEVEIPLGELFTRPVLADFARGLATAARAELPPIEPAPRDGRIPLSLAQQRLWILEQLGELGSAYHIHKRRRLRGELDRAALRRALEGVVARHEALRTVFAQVDGVPEQRIAPAEVGFVLREHDLRGRADADAGFDRLVAEEARAPFDLERGPLIRGRLVRMAEDDHVLLVTMHHIVSDAWSSSVFFGELSALYTAYREGREADLPPLPVQYADYAVWQRRWVEGEVLREQADYWARTLADAPQLLELPTDHPRPARIDHAGALLGVELDEALTAGLKALSRRHGTTLFMTLLAGWSVVLSRLSGQEDVVIGTPAANRGHREIEGLIGFFVNTLALRMDLSASPTVAELLGRVKERTLGAQAHQDIPFEQVVELVDPVRSLSHGPLFQVTFAWQNLPQGGGLSLPGVELGRVGGGAAHVPALSDLGLELAERDGRIRGVAMYATALFDRESVERHVGYLRRVLEEMVAGDARRVDRLALLSPGEQSRVVEEWNRTDADYPRESCIHQLFELQADRAPGADAVLFGDERVSYGELNARANRLAHHLRSRGVGPDVRVGLCVERGPAMLVGLLAVLKAGGAYLPLDPAYPAERIRWMLDDSAPVVVLTQASLAERFADDAVLVLDAVPSPWAAEPETNPERDPLRPEHLAYVIYTSGSTGRPKGVLVPHRGLCNVAAAQQRAFGVGPGDRVLQFASLSFDAAAFEVIMALASGAALCTAPREELLPGPGLLGVLRKHAVTTVTLPPSALAALPLEELPALRTITVAGEALPAELVARWGGGRRLWNLYGPTEATIWSTAAECSDAGRKPDIGGPISNVRAYVLDAGFEPLPLGVPGELYLGGAGVARGYLGRPGLTAERFVPDPFGGEAGARLYRTGDRVRWTGEGRLDFTGRMDHQVKVRGFRIEPGEIEARLAGHPGVREAVVVAREDVPGDRRLVAYVVGDDTAGADVLRAHLGESLPEYMVPAAYVRMDELPLTPSGKVDRGALPAPEGGAFAARGYEAPLGETEAALAGIWAEVLGIERVGRWDNFFELGGHSLLAVQVISLMREIDLHVEVQALFEAPTLAALAAEVGRDSREVEVPDNRIPDPEAADSTNQDIYL